jgi:hypothetical protein
MDTYHMSTSTYRSLMCRDPSARRVDRCEPHREGASNGGPRPWDSGPGRGQRGGRHATRDPSNILIVCPWGAP